MSFYEPIDSKNGEIRLLELHAARNHDAPIVCTFKCAILSQKPTFEALSYVWGREERGTDVLVDGTNFRVYENCEAALRRLRKRRGVRTIWIDAICINQKDKAEKSLQIQLMQNIYQEAEQVCVWLGELAEGTIVGVKSVQGSLSMGWHMWKVDRSFGKLTLPVRASFKNSVAMMDRSNLVGEQEMGEVKELLDRPWFSRVWIMQEAILATKLTFICGPETMEWDRMGDIIDRSWIFKGHLRSFGQPSNPKDMFPDETYQVIQRFRKLRDAGGWDIKLYDLLYDYRHLQCTVPHDRIYGFLGLAPEALTLGIVPDYNLTAARVYISTAKAIILKTRCLDILNYRREWVTTQGSIPTAPRFAYSLVDQARYHDVNALLTDGPDRPQRRGWARLPPGWERKQDKGKPCYYLKHGEGEFKQPQSPLEGKGATPASYFANQKVLPSGWQKDWTNLGQPKVEYSPQSTDWYNDLFKHLKSHGLDTLPSWVPNWAARTEYDPVPFLDWSHSASYYQASGDAFNVGIDPIFDDTILQLEGITFDVIESLAAPWHPSSPIGPFSRKGIKELQEWESLAVAEVERCPYAQSGGRHNALWRTLIADWTKQDSAPPEDWLYIETWYDRVGWQPEAPDLTSMGIRATMNMEYDTINTMEGKMAEHFYSLAAETTEFQNYVVNSSTLKLIKNSFAEAPKVTKKYGEYVRRIRKACAHRAMYVTKRGYIGLAPWNARQGDLLCILKGGRTPFLLRLAPAGSVYKLVGETYVYGIMAGEGVTERWETFNVG
ncbi:heterokaryon incompatibility protein-domain-containing protein [Xylariales sp. PMI_506]|nr:heterokaryon incompatibility protein-domain-containing protein [Xylariales sp. PMI_506]